MNALGAMRVASALRVLAMATAHQLVSDEPREVVVRANTMTDIEVVWLVQGMAGFQVEDTTGGGVAVTGTILGRVVRVEARRSYLLDAVLAAGRAVTR